MSDAGSSSLVYSPGVVDSGGVDFKNSKTLPLEKLDVQVKMLLSIKRDHGKFKVQCGRGVG